MPGPEYLKHGLKRMQGKDMEEKANNTNTIQIDRISSKSIASSLIFWLLGLIGIIVIGLGSLYYAYISKDLYEGLYSESRDMTDKFVTIVSKPLWNFDVKGVAIISEAYLQSKNVTGIRIEQVLPNNDSHVFFSDGVTDGPDIFSFTRPIQDHGERIGRAEIFFTEHNIIKTQRIIIISILLVTGVTLLVVSFLTRFILNRLFRYPVEQLNQGIRDLAYGHYERRLEYMNRKELDYIIAEINEMAGQIEQRSKQLEDAWSETNQLRNYLSNIINSMPSVLIGTDSAGRITQWNYKAEEETGIPAGTAVGKELDQVYPGFMDQMETIRKAIHQRKVLETPARKRKVGDDSRYEDITIYPLVTNGVDGAVIRVDDKTEQKRLEEMMIQSEKMLSVGGLAAGMAHEINNPLGGIMQNAQVVIKRVTADMPANEKAAEEAGTTMESIRAFMESRKVPHHLEMILEAGKRAATIVENMLSFARKGTKSLDPCDLVDLLEKTVELAEKDYDLKKKYDFKRIRIEREYEENIPMVKCEYSKIQQVFLNILKNGAEAMAGQERDAGDKTGSMFILRVKHRDGAVFVEIEDNGPGIPEPVRKRIFEPFFTTKPVGVGTGLGLSVSYFIITQNHAGEMSVESEPGKGANFIIKLPV